MGKIETGAALVRRSGQALGGIVDSSREVTGVVDGIAGAAGAQAQDIERVNRSVADIDRVTQTAASEAEQLAETARALTQHAGELEGLVARFKLNEREADYPLATTSAANASSASQSYGPSRNAMLRRVQPRVRNPSTI